MEPALPPPHGPRRPKVPLTRRTRPSRAAVSDSEPPTGPSGAAAAAAARWRGPRLAPERMRQVLSKHLGARCGSGWADGGSNSDPADEASCLGDIDAASGSVRTRCAGTPRHESRRLSSARHEHATRRRTKQASSVPTAPVGLHCSARCPRPTLPGPSHSDCPPPVQLAAGPPRRRARCGTRSRVLAGPRRRRSGESGTRERRAVQERQRRAGRGGGGAATLSGAMGAAGWRRRRRRRRGGAGGARRRRRGADGEGAAAGRRAGPGGAGRMGAGRGGGSSSLSLAPTERHGSLVCAHPPPKRKSVRMSFGLRVIGARAHAYHKRQCRRRR